MLVDSGRSNDFNNAFLIKLWINGSRCKIKRILALREL